MIATQNSRDAADVAVPATPPNPKRAATIATIRNTTAQYSKLLILNLHAKTVSSKRGGRVLVPSFVTEE
jgi:hypothetical protein